MAKAVFDIKSASASDLRALDRHCRERTSDGWSAIDLERSHLNRILVGSGDGVSASLKDWYRRTKARRPAKQSESPYYSLVLSASSEYLESDANLELFLEETMTWLRDQVGDELVYAELHLDETTPHIHAVVAPTYAKKKRIPGRRRKDETEEDFQARRRAVEKAPGERTVGRSYHRWAGPGSYEVLRRSYCDATDLDYGQKLTKGLSGRETREWVKEQVETNARHRQLVIDAGSGLKRRKEQLDRREAVIERREVEVERDRSELLRLKRSVGETLRRLKALVPWSMLSRSKSDALRSSLDEAEIGLDSVKPKNSENRKDRAVIHDNQGVNIGM